MYMVAKLFKTGYPIRFADAAITAAAASAISRLFFINESLLSLFFYERSGWGISGAGGYPAVASGEPEELLNNLTVKSG